MSNTRNINFANDTGEFIYNDYKVYTMPASVVAGGLLLAVVFRAVMWIMIHLGDYSPIMITSIATVGILVVASSCLYLGYRLYAFREFLNNELLLTKHAVISGLVVAAFFVIAMWENVGQFMFGVWTLAFFAFAAIGLPLSWAIRRWADKRHGHAPIVEEVKTSFWADAGFGSTNEVDCHAIPGGYLHKLKLDPKVTAADLQKEATLIAKNYNTNVKKIRITEDADDTNFAYVTKFDNEPFADDKLWIGPDKPGLSIAEPIEIATYDIGNRQSIYLSGKNGASCHHWLTVGMSGSGKTYAWQGIYASVLNRTEVSLVYIDASKGVASGMPLASGIEWFAWDMDSAIDVINGVQRAIKARQSALTQKGLPYWKPGCGMNFIIFHVEEAADYISNKEANDKLTHIARAARSAGIALIYSLQRATNKELPVTLREQLEGRMTFKVGQKKENALALSGTSQEAGAQAQNIPVKGGFYMTSPYIDDFYAGNILRVDAFDEQDLERAVEQGAINRTPLDNVTASAFGQAYYDYRAQVDAGLTEWQRIKAARGAQEQPQEGTFKGPESHAEAPTEEFNTETPKKNKASNLNSDRQSFIDGLWDLILEFTQDTPEFTRKDIKDYAMLELEKSESWIYARLKEFIAEGKLGENGNKLFVK
jgi:hypothetical protein